MKTELTDYHIRQGTERAHLAKNGAKHPLCRSTCWTMGQVALRVDLRGHIDCVKCQQAMVRLGIHPEQEKPQ